MQEIFSKLAAKEKDTSDAGLKRSRSSSLAAATGPQRIPLGPGRAVTTNGTAPAPTQNRIAAAVSRFHKVAVASRSQPHVPVAQEEVVAVEDEEEWDDMEVEQPPQSEALEDDNDHSSSYEEIEAMVDEQAAPEHEVEPAEPKPLRIWPELATERANRYKREIEDIREHFQEEVDEEDTTMVAEYADEIFKYMTELEVSQVGLCASR